MNQPDLLGRTEDLPDPALAFRSAAKRRLAWSAWEAALQAWIAAGRHGPLPLPAPGAASASLDAAMQTGHYQQPGWRR